MPDIAMCPGKETVDGVERVCPKMKQCYRHTAEPTPKRQAYMALPVFGADDSCTQYLPVAFYTAMQQGEPTDMASITIGAVTEGSPHWDQLMGRAKRSEQPVSVVYFPPQTHAQRLYSRFRLRLSLVKTWLRWRWWDISSPFRPHCAVHTDMALYKGNCSACEVEEFIRQRRLEQLRGRE